MRRMAALVVVLVLAMPFPAVGEPTRDEVTLAFTGDVLIHGGLSRRAASYGRPYDFRPMFAPVATLLSGMDLAVCHLEVPLTRDRGRLASFPRFNAPAEVADALVYAGFDGCSTASNHSFDQGMPGIEETLAILSLAGLGHAGTAARNSQAWTATHYPVPGGPTVAHISATFWLNGLRLPDDSKWAVQHLDVPQLLAVAERARVEGADLVVVSMHCCVEFAVMPTTAQKEIARSLITSDLVDLVVGHHAHVVSPVEEVDGEFIFYGLGNFISGQRQTQLLSEGVIAVARAVRGDDGWRIATVEAIPTMVEAGTYRVLKAEEVNPRSHQRTLATLRSMGAPVHGFELSADLLDAGVVR